MLRGLFGNMDQMAAQSSPVSSWAWFEAPGWAMPAPRWRLALPISLSDQTWCWKSGTGAL